MIIFKKEFLKKYISEDISILLILAIVLNIARIFIFHSYYFIYLFWNIFLAILPFVISSILLYFVQIKAINKFFLFIAFICWILVFPNAPYIVTDLIHVGRGHGIPMLYDTFLLFSSAWLGLILGMHSLSHIEKIIKIYYSKFIINISIPVIVFLTSIGIYIGRYLRFNSWDVFVDSSLFNNILNVFNNPEYLRESCVFILLCSFFIYMSYRAWKINNIAFDKTNIVL